MTLFQSTSSARRTTGDWLDTWDSGDISIHVLREEDDGQNLPWNVRQLRFQSTSSARRTTANNLPWLRFEQIFQSTSSARRTTLSCKPERPTATFQSTSSARRTTQRQKSTAVPADISIHVLREEDDSKSTQKTCAAFAQKVQSFPRRAV